MCDDILRIPLDMFYTLQNHYALIGNACLKYFFCAPNTIEQQLLTLCLICILHQNSFD